MDPELGAIVTNIVALSVDTPKVVSTARTIKNAIVGNPTKKQLYIKHGVIPRLLQCANCVETKPALTEHAVAALGSLAPYLPLSVIPDVTATLLHVLFSTNFRSVHAAVRALKLLVCSSSSSTPMLSNYFVKEDVANRLVTLLSASDEGIAEVCAVIVARTTKTQRHAMLYKCASVVPALVSLLLRTSHQRCVEACVDALTALARYSDEVCAILTAPHCILSTLIHLTRSPVHSLRLATCRLLTIFHAVGRLPEDLDSDVTIVVVNLLSTDLSLSFASTALTLAELVIQNPDLQRVATDAGAVVKLASLLTSCDSMTDSNVTVNNSMALEGRLCKRLGRCEAPWTSTNFSKNVRDEVRVTTRSIVLGTLAALMDKHDLARDAVVAQNIIPIIVDGLSDPDRSVVRSSIQCVRALSRSVKILRKDISNGSIGESLLKLVDSDDLCVQRCASATICNLILEFSPIRTVILKSSGIEILVGLLGSEDGEVRRNALWALKNLLFKAAADLKSVILSSIGFKCLYELVTDGDYEIRKLAMTVLRNLAYSPTVNKQNEHLDALFAVTGSNFISVLSDELKSETTIELAVQTLYVVCNIAAGAERHKTYLLESDIPALVLRWTAHRDERVRIAAMWCIVNLSWKEKEVTMPCFQSRGLRRALRTPSRVNHALMSERLEMLRRQHLPLPASPQGRRIMERYSAGVANARLGSSARFTVNGMGALEEHTGRGSNQRRNRHDFLPDVLTAQMPHGASEDRMDNNEATAVADNEGVGNGGEPVNEPDERENVNGDGSRSGNASGHAWRIERLRQLGFEQRLQSLVNDPHVEVQGRARAALEMFSLHDSPLLECDPAALMNSGSLP